MDLGLTPDPKPEQQDKALEKDASQSVLEWTKC